VRIRQHTADRGMRRVRWKFRLKTLLVTIPFVALLVLAALFNAPYRSEARSHDVAALIHAKHARSNREWSVARPDEAADYLRLATMDEARVAYHEALSRKYWRLTARPWAWKSVPPDPPPPP
jgi:hypothetical protein